MRYAGCIFISLVIFINSCVTTKDNTQRAYYHYQLGLSYLSDDNIQPAFVEFQKALELKPDNKDVLNALGIIYLLKLKNYPEAIRYFQRALAIDKNFSEASNNLGIAYTRIGRFNDAIESYKTALSNPLYRSAENAFNNLGWVYYKLKKYNDAIDAFKEAIKRSPDFHLPYYGLALCYNAQGQYSDAETAITTAIKVDPLYRGDKKKAIEDFKNKKAVAEAEEKKEIIDYLEILLRGVAQPG